MLKKVLSIATMLLVGAAYADILVYEGFNVADYGNITGNSTYTASSGKTTGEYTVGINTGAWAGQNGTQIKVYSADYGLNLPEALLASGQTVQGGSIGLNPGSNNSELRAQNHSFITDTLKVSDGKLYVRMLLNIDSKAAAKLSASSELTQKNGGYYGFGLCQATGGGNYYLLTSTKSALAFVIWKNENSEYVLSFSINDASNTRTTYPIITGIEFDTTYICYAEIEIGAGTDGKEIVRAGAYDIAGFAGSPLYSNIGGETDFLEIEYITDSTYPTAMAVAGPYGSVGRFRGDELLVATEYDDVFVSGGIYGIMSSGAPTFDMNNFTANYTLVSDANVLSDVYFIYDTDESFSNATTVQVGSLLASGDYVAEIAGLEPDKTYYWKLYSESEAQTGETVVGSFTTLGAPIIGEISSSVDGTTATFTIELEEAALINGLSTDVSVFYSVDGETWVETELGSAASTATLEGTVENLNYGASYQWYAVATATMDNGRITETISGTEEFLVLWPYDIYVNAAAENPVSPYSTPETATAKLADAIVVAEDGATIYVAPGVYPQAKRIVLTKGVSVVGTGSDIASVVVSNTVSAGYHNQVQQIFHINHPDAFVANLTMANGEGYETGCHGGSFYIGESGGVVSNCVAVSGYCRNNSLAAGAYLHGGLVTHTTFRKCRAGTGSANWADDRPGVLYLRNNSRAENCLIDDCSQSSPVVLVKLDGNAIMRNCTIVNSSLSATNQYCSSWSSLNFSSGTTVENVVIAGVTNTVDGAVCLPTGARSKFVNGALDGDITDLSFPEGTIVGTAEEFFTDYAAGNYRPRTGGILADKGVNYEGMALYDLTGTQNRLIGSYVDIGCYESFAAGTVLLIK